MMEPVAPPFLVAQLAKAFAAEPSLACNGEGDTAERAALLLLAASSRWLHVEAPQREQEQPQGGKHGRPQAGQARQTPTAGSGATLQRAARSQLYGVLRSLVDGIVSSPALLQLCYQGCCAAGDRAAIDAAAAECMSHATARAQTSGTMSQLHSQMWEGPRVKDTFQEEYCRTSALVMTKQWNRSAHEWCAAAAREFFLMDSAVRARWLARDPKSRSLITALAPEMKRRMDASRAATMEPATGPRLGDSSATPSGRGGAQGQHRIAHDVAASLLPGLGKRLRLVDVGSCRDFFGQRYPDLFDAVALDLCPAEPTVFSCDFLELGVSAAAADPPTAAGTPLASAVPVREKPERGSLKSLTQHSFDVVVVSQVLSFIPDPEARAVVLAKARRLLGCGESGLLLIVEPARVIRHAGPELVAAVELRGFRHVPGLKYGRHGEAGVGLAFATVPVEEGMPKDSGGSPVHLPAHPGHTASAASTSAEQLKRE